VESGGCLKRLSGRVRSGLVLKDVSMVVHSGELLAVLGSKGISNLMTTTISEMWLLFWANRHALI
jgi:ABC-type multidrug transport system ATPase subunit